MKRSEPDDPIAISLASAHSAVNARHVESRTRLMEALSDTSRSCTPVHQSTTVWRYVVAGLGIGAAAAAVVCAVWLLAPTSPAVAMEQLAKALDQVNAYSYRMESIHASRKGQGRTVRQITVGRWRTDPVGLHATIRLVETKGTNTATPSPQKTLVHLEETHHADGRGILIDHLKKEYWWVDEQITASSIPPGSPQVAVYMVRQRRGRVLRDLGEKKIEGQMARGLKILLQDGQPVSELGLTSAADDKDQVMDWRNAKVEVWIDPETDLPIEFRCMREGDEFETTYRFTNLEWNVDFASGAFAAEAPVGYAELDKSPWAEKQCEQ